MSLCFTINFFRYSIWFLIKKVSKKNKNLDKKEELKKYLALIGKPVEKEFATFSVKEDRILNQYGAWMTALIKGEINPMTKNQNE